MSINDRLRIAIFAGVSDRQYGRFGYGEESYGADLSWNFGTLLFGDFDFGRRIGELTPGGESFSCYITSMTLDLGRQRPLDQNKIGALSLQAVQFDVPDMWISEDAAESPEALVVGRTIVLEALNDGEWEAIFTGTIEAAVAEVIGTGVFEQPQMRWEIFALDNLNSLQRVTEAPGTRWRPEETSKSRIEYIAGIVGLQARYLSTSYPAAETHPTEFESNLLVEVQNALKYRYRVSASQDGQYIDVEDLKMAATWPFYVADPQYVFISSPHELWANSNYRLLLPCPTTARQTWAMDRLLNQVTVLTPDVPTDPTPETYVRTNTDSINAFGRRTYQDTIPMVEAAGVQTPALDLANMILAAYGEPRPWVTEVPIDFTTRIDLDTPEPIINGVGTYGTYDVGLTYAMRMLRTSRILALTLPSTDAGRLVGATGYVLGIQWNITADTAKCTVYMEALPEKYGASGNPEPPLEPPHPTGNEGILFGMFQYGWTITPQMTFNVPATVNPLDVEIEMDVFDPGQGRSYFMRSPTTLNVPRAEFYVNDPQLYLRGTDAAGTMVAGFSMAYNTGMKREILSLVVSGSSVNIERRNPGATPGWSPQTVSTAVSGLWFAAGNQISLGWAGPSSNAVSQFILFGFRILKRSTGQVLLHVRPEDWKAGSWTDPYGNVITVTESVRYSNDIPAAYMEA